MSVLHTINKSSFTHNVLESCVRVCSPKDALLFIEDGVFGAMQQSPCAEKLNDVFTLGTAIYALESDVNARGIAPKIPQFIKLISYDEFVKLAVDHNCIQSWY